MIAAANKIDLRLPVRLIRREILNPYVNSGGDGMRSRSMSLGAAEAFSPSLSRLRRVVDSSLQSLPEDGSPPSRLKKRLAPNGSSGTMSASQSPPTSRRLNAVRTTSLSPSRLHQVPASIQVQAAGDEAQAGDAEDRFSSNDTLLTVPTLPRTTRRKRYETE